MQKKVREEALKQNIAGMSSGLEASIETRKKKLGQKRAAQDGKGIGPSKAQKTEDSEQVSIKTPMAKTTRATKPDFRPYY